MRHALQSQLELPVAQLSFNGEDLEHGDATLRECGILHGSRLHLKERTREAATEPKPETTRLTCGGASANSTTIEVEGGSRAEAGRSIVSGVEEMETE
eukprot:3988142-Prymnesium_polylepis.1